MFSSILIKFTDKAYPALVKHEKIIYSAFLLISLLQLWLTKYVPSLDGPQHLYNANVLVELIKGNELFHSFFKVNDVLVGYWSGHFFLAFFKFFLPAWLAEKFFLTTYVLAMVFSFRYLVKSMNPAGGNFVSYLIFPFLFHSYLLMGYYSFSIAAIFFFLAFGYWIRHQKEFTLVRMGVFSLIVFGLFLSHGFVYVLFGVAFITYFGVSLIYDLVSKNEEFSWKDWLMKLLKLTIAVLPSLIFWYIYIQSVMGINSTVVEPSFTFGELLKFLLRIRQLVGFHHEKESLAYIPLFVLLAVLTIVCFVRFIPALKDKSRKIAELFDTKNAWLFVAAVFLGFYFFAPNRISAGSLTHRFGVFFYFSFIVWLSVQKFPKIFQLFSLIVILFSISYARVTHLNFYKNLNKDIADIEELAEVMEDNSIVTYQQASNNWVHGHFQLYAAMDKPLLHLKNPQCQGQFPVEWALDSLPYCYAGSKNVVPAGANYERGISRDSLQVDYITIFRKDDYFKDSTNIEWWGIIEEYYTELKTGSKGRAVVYGRR